MGNLKIVTSEEVWEVAEETINSTYKAAYGKSISDSFGDIAESEGYLDTEAWSAYRNYMRNIREDSDLESYVGSTLEDIRKDFEEWYKKSEMFSEITLQDLKDFME